MPRISGSAIVKRIGLFVAAIGFVLLLGEGLVRGVAHFEVSNPDIEDWDGIIAGRPGAHGRHRFNNIFDGFVNFNQQRFRGTAETQIEPTPGVLRVATLGDAITMGWGVNDDQTYPAYLQALLQQELGRPVEVLNAGVLGTGTSEQALYYRRWVERFHPQIVVLEVNSTDPHDDRSRGLFSIGADGVGIPPSPEAIQGPRSGHRRFRSVVLAIPGVDFLRKHSQLFAFVRYKLWRASHREEWMRSEELDRALPFTSAEIRWLNGEVRNSGGRLLLFYAPQNQWATYPAREGLMEERLAAMLRQISGQDQIPFSDISLAVRAATARSPEPLYLPGEDCFPTPRGNAVIARQVAELVKNHLQSPAQAPAPGH